MKPSEKTRLANFKEQRDNELTQGTSQINQRNQELEKFHETLEDFGKSFQGMNNFKKSED